MLDALAFADGRRRYLGDELKEIVADFAIVSRKNDPGRSKSKTKQKHSGWGVRIPAPCDPSHEDVRGVTLKRAGNWSYGLGVNNGLHPRICLVPVVGFMLPRRLPAG